MARKNPRIFLMLDHWIGLQAATHLKSKNENIVGAALHPPHMQHHAREILDVLQLPGQRVFTAEETKSPEFPKVLKKLKPDLILLIYWGFIVKPEVFALPPMGCINFHAGLLPFNRGKNPNVWPIMDGTPAGVTLHLVDEGIDTGPVLAQKEVQVEPVDTAETLYNKLLAAFVRLFAEKWPEIRSGRIQAVSQNSRASSFHYAKDFKRLEKIDINGTYQARELINQLRAKTFPPHPAAYFLDNGKKIQIRVQLSYADE